MMSEWWVMCASLYGAVGVFLWVKVTSAVLCIVCGGSWSRVAGHVPNSIVDGIRDAMSDMREATEDGISRTVGVTMLSLGFIALIMLQFVKCVVAWPIVFRVGIMRRLRELLSK